MKGGIELLELASKGRCKKEGEIMYERGKGKRLVCWEFKSGVSEIRLI